jgi:hypothetical protein
MRRLLVLAVVCLAPAAWAHRPGDSLLRLAVDDARVDGRWDVALRDLDDAVGIDEDGDRVVTAGELRRRWPAVAAAVVAGLEVRGCALEVGPPAIATLSSGLHASVQLSARCGAPIATLTVRSELVFDIDAQHRTLVSLAGGGHAVLRDDARTATLDVAVPSRARRFAAFVAEGVAHIFAGLDHILFLLALLLPAVLGRGGAPVPRFAPAAKEVLRVVTAFTVAHSLTLALAALGVVTPPARLVETGIALTVVAAAVCNLAGLGVARWPLAFYLGLLHGFGFSGALGDLGAADLELALLGFNLGVELGQAAIVALFLPLAFAARGTWAYRRLVLAGGSLAVALVALAWTAERLFV